QNKHIASIPTFLSVALSSASLSHASRRLMRSSLLSLTGSVGLALVLGSAVAAAQPPAQQKTQAPGYFRLAVGDYEVTALFDGYNDLSPKLLKGMKPEQIRAMLARHAIE